MPKRRIVKRTTGATDPVEQPAAVRWPWLLSDAGVMTTALVVAGVGVVALVVMLQIAGDAATAERAKLQIEALKYGLGFFAAAGAVAALLLAVRRQRLSEHTHELALKAQAHTETDAAERRVTDLYGKAVEQLGSADAAVRLGGLYALERVAQNNPGQRQTIVNVLCAYLRMPYTPPTDTDPPGTAQPAPTAPSTALPLGSSPPAPAGGRDPHQELQVRLTAQRILTTHLTLPNDIKPQQTGTLTPGPQQPFWPDIDLDLTGANLIDWDLPRGHVRTATFTGATFTGNARFGAATFTGHARFDRATFTGDTSFGTATFTGNARFDRATFTGRASFERAIFTHDARFDRVTFTGKAWFGAASFDGNAWFDSTTTFTSDTSFSAATFTGQAKFDTATFTGNARFDTATFTGRASFDRATFTGRASFEGATFTGNARFDSATFTHDATFSEAQVAAREGRADVWPTGWRFVSGRAGRRLVYESPTTQA
jgi:hypothetical protein